MSLKFLSQTREFRRLLHLVKETPGSVSIRGLIEPAKAYFLACLADELQKPVVFIRPLRAELVRFSEQCNFFLAELGHRTKAIPFPPLFDNPYFEVSPSLEAVSERLKLFYDLSRAKPAGLIVTNPAGLLKPVPQPSRLSGYFKELAVGDEIDRDELISTLKNFGYGQNDIVVSRGEFAWRGGIVDLFSPWEQNPFRIEFSGSEIVSLRYFDVPTQKTIKKIESLALPALREFMPAPDFIQSWKDLARKRWPGGRDLKQKITALEQADFWPNFSAFALLNKHYFVPVSACLANALYVIDSFDETEQSWFVHGNELNEQMNELVAQNCCLLKPEEIFPEELWTEIKKNAVLLDALSSGTREESILFGFQSLPRFENKINFFINYLGKLQADGDISCIYTVNSGTRKRLSALLRENSIPFLETDSALDIPKGCEVRLLVGQLERGFSYPKAKINVFSERDIFTEEKIIVSRPPRKPHLLSFQDIKAGDYVVHNEYGIGMFLGLQALEIDGQPREFIEILYRDGDKLLVPVEDLNLVQKFSHSSLELPLLDKLGTASWEKTKTRARKAVQAIAKELVELYARRRSQKGYSFSSGEWEAELDGTFEYEETEDQLRSIQEVRSDMESDTPMDRLLCGDVGYGKTEVAVRAAFKAVMDGKQVAVLCPTTVLASQHLSTFRKRLALFPVRIEGLTRFQRPQEAKEILAGLAKGYVDIVIGTHRLLSRDVNFRDLGLLIIDEEQRFGVAQKEKLKQIKTEVDVLTLSATPIPRTLNMSLMGLRDISLIETPPRDRLSIHTVVTPFNSKLVAAAIRQEINRGGQVYYIHNLVEDIDAVAEFIKKLVPEARVVTIHGQMNPSLLEKRMLDFINHRYDVLVSTTIIENGIDIPLVNTLIVNRADTYGLAQLYQLRGRVGRSSRQAFAYFLVPPYLELSPQARERLKALKEFIELGSGFRLAAKDLEIRGAGTLLGTRQHGAIEEVGFEFYMQLLEQAVRELKGEVVETINPSVHLKVDIRIPEEFIPQTNLRLSLYKKIASVEKLDEINLLREEILDRFGPLPGSVENLLGYGLIKHLARQLKITSIDRYDEKVSLTFSSSSPVKWTEVQPILKKRSGYFKPEGIMVIKIPASSEAKVISATSQTLIELARCIKID